MLSENEVRGLGSRAVCDLLQVPSSTLNYWVQIGIVKPSIRGPEGRRVEHYWSVEDIVIVRAIRELRRRGASLQQVRKARVELARWGASMSNARLFWDGRDVIVQDEQGDFVSAVRRPGQRVWFLASLPLSEWHAQTSVQAGPVDLDLIRERQRRRRQRARDDAEQLEGLVE